MHGDDKVFTNPNGELLGYQVKCVIQLGNAAKQNEGVILKALHFGRMAGARAVIYGQLVAAKTAQNAADPGRDFILDVEPKAGTRRIAPALNELFVPLHVLAVTR